MYVKINPDYETGPVIHIPKDFEPEQRTVAINLNVGTQKVTGSFDVEIIDSNATDFVVMPNISSIYSQVNSTVLDINALIVSMDPINVPLGEIQVQGLVEGITVDDQFVIKVNTNRKIPPTTIILTVDVKSLTF